MRAPEMILGFLQVIFLVEKFQHRFSLPTRELWRSKKGVLRTKVRSASEVSVLWVWSEYVLSVLRTYQNMENTWNKRQFHHFGGCWAYISGLRIFVRAPEVQFFDTWKCQKCPSLCAQKWHFRCPNKSSETTFISPTSPKNDGIGFCFKRLPLLEGFLANF